MAVEVPSKIKQMNGGTYKLMDLADIDNGDGTSAKDLVDGQIAKLSEVTAQLSLISSGITGETINSNSYFNQQVEALK